LNVEITVSLGTIHQPVNLLKPHILKATIHAKLSSSWKFVAIFRLKPLDRGVDCMTAGVA
jgi:hypothetical protein